MKKVLGLVFVLAVMIMAAGCEKASDEMTEKSIEAETGADVDIDSSEGKMTIEGDDGKVEIETNMKDVKEGDWCPEGGEWKMTATGAEDATAHWKIDKLVTSGEYAGLCHVIYTADTPQGQMKMDYWFDESGENGYYEMEMNGQTVKQEWHSS